MLQRCLVACVVVACALFGVQVVSGVSVGAAGPTLTLTPGTAIRGESVLARGMVPANRARPVTLQVWRAGAWTKLLSAKTGSAGVFRFGFRAPAASSKYRVVAPVSGRMARQVTPVRSLVVAAQQSTLAVAGSVSTDSMVRMRVGSRPIRVGRPLAVQQWMGGQWVQVVQGTETSAGFVDLQVRAPAVAGVVQYRPVSLAFGGAPAHVGSPVKVSVAGGWRVLGPTCGIRTTGVAECRGGFRGNGSALASPAPYQLPFTWKSISTDTYLNTLRPTTCAIRSDDTGWCWGGNEAGQVGNGTVEDQVTPTRLPGSWKFIGVSGRSTCGIRLDDTGWCWGENGGGQLGIGSTVDALTPVQLPGRWRSLETLGVAPCGFQTDGSAWCWGDNPFGGPGMLTSPTRVPGNWLTFSSTSSRTTCGVRADHTGWCWGSNDFGEVTGEAQPTEQLITQMHNVPGQWQRITTGAYTTCGVRSDSVGVCWGANAHGQFGNGTATKQPATEVAGQWRELFPVRAFPSAATVCGFKSDGSAWCWGYNREGAVGTGDTRTQYTPFRLPIAAAALSRDATGGICAVTTASQGWCWGSWAGQVAEPTATQLGTPTRVP